MDFVGGRLAKFEADASARTEYEPSGGFAVSVQHVGDLIHAGAGVAQEAGAASCRPRLMVRGIRHTQALEGRIENGRVAGR